MKSILQSQEERAFAEVKRISHAGLDGLELLLRLGAKLPVIGLDHADCPGFGNGLAAGSSAKFAENGADVPVDGA